MRAFGHACLLFALILGGLAAAALITFGAGLALAVLGG